MPSFITLLDGRLVEQTTETWTYRRYYERDSLSTLQVQQLRNARARELRQQGFKVQSNSYLEFCCLSWWDERPRKEEVK